VLKFDSTFAILLRRFGLIPYSRAASSKHKAEAIDGKKLKKIIRHLINNVISF
jgi:hypothetical protein